MNKTVKIIFGLLIMALVFSVVILPQFQVQAFNEITTGLNNAVKDTDLPHSTPDLKTAIGKIVQTFLGFLGVLAVVLIIYAGFLWLTAGGDPSKVDKAKGYIKNAVIGLIIILAAYIITSFVITKITETLK